VLERPGGNLFERGWQLPEPVQLPRIPAAPAPVPTPVATGTRSVPRNAPCPCGSGQKFKRCCGSPISPGAASPGR
jgi:preprotein translocase subunit SecA